MTKQQRKNSAKYFYDISKVVFTLAILGNLLAWEKFNAVAFCFGMFGAVATFMFAYLIDGEAKENE